LEIRANSALKKLAGRFRCSWIDQP